MTSKKRMFLDASAWINFLKGETFAQKVAGFLERCECFTSLVNYYEVLLWYQHRYPDRIAEISRQIAASTRLVSLDESVVLDALQWKRRYPAFSMADALSYASSRKLGATFVTADFDFDKVPGIIMLR